MQRQNIIKEKWLGSSPWDSKLSVVAKDLPVHFCELAAHKTFSGIMFRVAELEEVSHLQAKLSVCAYMKEFNIEYHRILRISHASRATNVSTMMLIPQTPLFKVTQSHSNYLYR